MVNDMFRGPPPPFWLTGLVLTGLALIGVCGIWKVIECAVWVWNHVGLSIT
jgi:hypothetical protein